MFVLIAAGLLAAAVHAAPFASSNSRPPSPAALRRQSATPLPDYALAYAPLYHLHRNESWWPSDIATHLANVIPEIDFKPVPGFTAAGSATLANLATVNASAYLTSKDNVDTSPDWQLSGYGKPNTTGYSAAPGTIVAVQKNATWVDVFYFTFYSYNHGGAVLGIQFDDHVGDWEHTMVRFVDGLPTAVYYSQHAAGSAYTYSAVNKTATGRPLAFIGLGGHANYAKAGNEQYTVAGTIVTDKTSADGLPWDFAQHYRGYWFDNTTKTFAPGGGVTTDDASWLQWTGVWGDAKYSTSRTSQYCLFGECHYTAGPTGPVAKNLGRQAVCQKESSCKVYTSEDDITHQSRRAVNGGE